MTVKKPRDGIARVKTGVRNFDDILEGGLPKASVTVIGGPPGSGKTMFAHQFCFANATPQHRALYFNTLSEPTAKTLRYMQQMNFFDAAKFDRAIQYVDLGGLLRQKGLAPALDLMMAQIRKTRPAIVVIDSFRVFNDLASSAEELRKFGYEIGVNLMAWETTALLLGEYGPHDYESNPVFSVIDGLVMMSRREESGEQQRFIQVVKMRGTGHSHDEHAFAINTNGVEVYAPRVTIRRSPEHEHGGRGAPRLFTGITNLDALIGDGIPLGSSVLVSGAAGTGKTVLLLEFIYRGALAGERGVLFSFEETEERLLATARALGWDLERQIEAGLVQIVFIPQPDIQVERHLLMVQELLAERGAQRVAIDSVSVFLHKMKDPQLIREKVFQLGTLVQNAQAVGFFAADVPYGSKSISRFGVEETVVDGVILLTSEEDRLQRNRYIEIYKLRNTAHRNGRHGLLVGRNGIQIFPRPDSESGMGPEVRPEAKATRPVAAPKKKAGKSAPKRRKPGRSGRS